MKRIHAFVTGTHTDSSGSVETFDAARLREVQNAYNGGAWRAPITIGHPSNNAPAFGWIGKVEFDDAGLWAEPSEVSPELKDWNEKGYFRNISASFYPPGHPNNPTPGKWNLRHIGVLGAQPPAIKAIGQHTFSENDVPVYEYSELSDFLTRFREWLIENRSREEADEVVPQWMPGSVATTDDAAFEAQVKAMDASYDIDNLRERLNRIEDTLVEAMRANDVNFSELLQELKHMADDKKPAGPDVNTLQAEIEKLRGDLAEAQKRASAVADFSEQQNKLAEQQRAFETAAAKITADFAEQQKKIEDQARQLEERAGIVAKIESDARHAAHISFADSVASEGKIHPRQKEIVASLLDGLIGSEQTVDFAEEDGKTSKLKLADAFRQFLKSLPKAVDFNEHYQPNEKLDDLNANAAGRVVDFGEYQADQRAMTQHQKIVEYMRQHNLPDDKYAEAALRVMGG